MAAWFKKIKTPLRKVRQRTFNIPEGLWVKCDRCKQMIYRKELERNLRVCPKCDYHYRMGARERISILIDEGTFVEHHSHLRSADPLKFRDTLRYAERLRSSMRKVGTTEAAICGEGNVDGTHTHIAALHFEFMGGSMGSVVGEKVTRTVEDALEKASPVVVVSCSGGARMQEGVLSLMQMAKTGAALAKMSRAGLPCVSILTDPTTGGVTASFAMLGDVIIAEPGALIGFAGPRVIEQTINRTLPEGFQRAEFLQEHGMVDMVVHRRDLKRTVGEVLALLG